MDNSWNGSCSLRRAATTQRLKGTFCTQICRSLLLFDLSENKCCGIQTFFLWVLCRDRLVPGMILMHQSKRGHRWHWRNGMFDKRATDFSLNYTAHSGVTASQALSRCGRWEPFARGSTTEQGCWAQVKRGFRVWSAGQWGGGRNRQDALLGWPRGQRGKGDCERSGEGTAGMGRIPQEGGPIAGATGRQSPDSNEE